MIVLAVYAYDVGGASAVGVAALVRLLPAAFTAPVTSLLADRSSRRDGFLVGAIAGGSLIAAASAQLGFAVTAAVCLLAAFLIHRIPHDPRPPHRDPPGNAKPWVKRVVFFYRRNKRSVVRADKSAPYKRRLPVSGPHARKHLTYARVCYKRPGSEKLRKRTVRRHFTVCA